MLALLAAIPVAIVPATSREVPEHAVAQAEAALAASLPQPFEAAKLDVGTIAEHLAAAGTACRADPECLCSAAPLTPGTRVLDLDVARLSDRAWAADLRLVAPCEGQVLDRKAAVVESDAASLSRFCAEAAGAMLRGRDLPPLRFSGTAKKPATPAGVAPARTVAAPKSFEDTEADLTRLLAAAPDDVNALITRGETRLQLAKTNAALQDFQRAHDLAPENGRALFGLAEAHRLLGLRRKAAELYRDSAKAEDLTAEERGRAERWSRALQDAE